jgi:HD-like signal output (HDOD) protein
MPHQCSAALRLAAERKIALHESEEALLGISHAELGAYLLGMWGIEQPVVEAVAHHHKPTRIPHHGFDASTAVFLAGLLSEELELHPRDTEGAELRAADRESLERLELMAQFGMFRERAARALDAR